jgi:hypothetical protein
MSTKETRVVKAYETEDLRDLTAELEYLCERVAGLADTMTNGEPWAARWLGGDATEVRPDRFQAALDAVRRAASELQGAGHQTAMLVVEG